MLELIGLVAGLLIGAFFPWTIPAQWSLYVAAGLLAALDSALGGFRARVKGEFKLGVFLSGTIGNAAIAVFLTWLGQKLGLPLYLAAVLVFGTRMFQNFAEIRHDKRMNDCLPPILFSAIFKLLKVLPDTELDAC